MADALQVQTTGGPVLGRHKDGVSLFAGLAYAAAPTGDRRFRAPAPVHPWTDVRDASRFGPAAPQLPGEGLTSATALAWDEATCLTLNVTTPAADEAARPVMVWIHGGDYKHGMGAIPWYNGANFAKNGDVVLVSINYRLGAFGFTRLDHIDPSFAGSGMAGILDQVAALQWVRDNIAAFGGNPDEVTIFGESAGAFSVATLMAQPEAAGLFHKAILQSGSGHAVHDADQGANVAERLMDVLDVSTVEALQAVDADALLAAQKSVESIPLHQLGLTNSPFYPTVDGVALRHRPVDAMAHGASASVPVLLGSNADETKLWGTQATPAEKLERLIGRNHPDPATAIATYRKASGVDDPGELAVALTTDWMFRVPAVRVAEARFDAADTWMYHFDWQSTAFGGALGSCHALEIPFVFDNLQQAGVDAFAGPDAPQALADAMHASWIAFARTGSPVTDLTPQWEPYRADTRVVQRFGQRLHIDSNPDAELLAVWDGVR